MHPPDGSTPTRWRRWLRALYRQQRHWRGASRELWTRGGIDQSQRGLRVCNREESHRVPRGLCNAISVACQLRKKATAAGIGRLGVWTNHVKISVVASENALQPNEPIASHPRTFGLGNGHGVVCAVASGLGGEVTVYIVSRVGMGLLLLLKT